jgi:hypothetical protein
VPADLLGAAVVKVAAELGERADVVLVMTGSVLLRSQPVFLAAEQAEVILLVERSRARMDDLRIAVEVILRHGSEVGAVVLVRGRPGMHRR